MDLTNGERSIVSDASTGDGVGLLTPEALVLDEAGNRVLVVDSGRDALLSIDLATGDRAVLSDNSNEGDYLYTPRAVGVDPSTNRAWILDGLILFQVDLATGDREYLSTGTIDFDFYVGSGLRFGMPRSMFVAPSEGIAWVGDARHRLLLATDLTTGRRSLPWGDHTPRAATVAVDEENGVAYAMDSWLGGAVRIDLETGAQTLIADEEIGSGEVPKYPRDLVINPMTRQPIYVDSLDYDDNDWYSAAVAIDPDTGDRTVLSGTQYAPNVGSGPGLYEAPATALDAAEEQLITMTLSNSDACSRRAVLRIELATGDRSPFSGHDDCGFDLGMGPKFGVPLGVAMSPDAGYAYVTDYEYAALLLVDLTTGDRTLVSDASTGSGPLFQAPGPLTIDSAGGRAIVADYTGNDLLGIDLATGNRTILVTEDPEYGPSLADVSDIVLDVVPGVALVTTRSIYGRGITGGVLMVDLETGYRVVLWH